MSEAEHVMLAHGNGGRRMRELIESVFARHLANPSLDVDRDAAPLDIAPGMVPFITTDAFTVQPLEFPGGDIGSLAVNGTVNDLAVAGALPRYLTLAAIIEEGFPLARLERIVRSAARAAEAAGVRVVAGDTKVVPRGQGGGLYLITTGVGLRAQGPAPGMTGIAAGDLVLASGTLGDHGIAVLLARQEFDIGGSICSDCAPVTAYTSAIVPIPGLRFMRDPTRGGLASVAHEIAAATGLGVRLREQDVPVRDAVRSCCTMLGYDPYYLASEGRVIAVASPEAAPRILAAWRALPGGGQACAIGRIDGEAGPVILDTAVGGERFVEELEDDPLPRIC